MTSLTGIKFGENKKKVKFKLFGVDLDVTTDIQELIAKM